MFLMYTISGFSFGSSIPTDLEPGIGAIIRTLCALITLARSSDKFVNLLEVNRQGLFISENSNSLKNMEKFYHFKREGDVQRGDVSQEYYIEWLETNDKKFLEEIESYNKQDCHSTYKLHKWLLDKKPEETSWFIPKKNGEMELRDFEIDMITYQEKVEKCKKCGGTCTVGTSCVMNHK